MKIGIRTPSLKKSFKARTTGKLKRSIKSSLNPLYGKKGIGFVRSPKKSIYNKVYKKTSFSIFDIIKKYLSKRSKYEKILLFMLMVSIICFGNLTIVNSTSDYLRSNSIKTCNGVTYGKHSSDNHWHVAIKNSDGKYNASGDPIYNDPCANNTDDSSNNETINASNSSKSSDATIKSITVNNNNIEVSDSMSYTTTEENSNIKVVLNNISASAQYNNDIELVIGDNLQTIKVIAENGNTKEYKLNIIREKELSNNKNIKIFVDNKEIKFTLYKNEELSISSKASKVNITYELEDDKASVEISGNENLKVGKNEIVITAIAENGDKQEYTLIVEKSSIATEIISSIVGITMLGGFCYLIYILIKKKKCK